MADCSAMASLEHHLLGVGLYSVPEAAHISRVPTRSIRRWMKGYEFTRADGSVRHMPALWQRDIEGAGTLVLTFRDLLEVRFVDAFLREGVKWAVIRRSAQVAAETFGESHPFATQRFLTDGRLIFAQSAERESKGELLELYTSQYAFADVVGPFLKDVEFAAAQPVRWWPLGGRRCVVIDPLRSFGRPITASGGVPTEVLASGYRIEQSYKAVASWYGIPVREVRDAVEFEVSRAA